MRAAALGVLLALVMPRAAGAGDWPQSRHDARNTGAVVLDAPASGRPHPWSFDGSGRVWGYEPGMTVWSDPALGVVEGRAVIAVGSYDRTLYCLDAASGEVRWKLTTGGPIAAAPVLWRDGGRVWLYAASSDRLIYALDAALGRQLWVHSVEPYRPTLGGARLSAAAVGAAGGRPAVFVGYWVWDSSLAHGLQRGGLVALGARDGKPIWRRELGDNQVTAPLYARVGGSSLVFAGSHNGSLYALAADTGEVRWRQTELDAIRSPPVVADTPGGPLVVMASRYGMVRALDPASGAERWHFKTGDRVTGAPAALIEDGRTLVVVGSYDRHLYALDAATGRLVWRYAARGGIYSAPAAAALARPLVLVAAWDHALHAVSLRDGAPVFTSFTGRPLWDVAGLDESNWSSPAAARVNGVWMAYVGSYDGTLRALPLDPGARAPAPLRSNVWFWLSFPLALGPLALLAILLTRRHRRRRQSSQAARSSSGTAA